MREETWMKDAFSCPPYGDIRRTRVLIRGAGEMATGVSSRLVRSGFAVCHTEAPHPEAVRRMVSFCEAVYDGKKTVEGLTAVRIEREEEVFPLWEAGKIPLLVDPENRVKAFLKPHVLIDAILAKRNLGTRITDAPLVIGLGPGFIAGVDVHAVIETNRGHDLGRIILRGQAEPNTGVPGIIAGYGEERVLRAPCEGTFRAMRAIGDTVSAGTKVAEVAGEPIRAAIFGVLRGLLRDGAKVTRGFKCGDIDPRGNPNNVATISDKAQALGGAALEAILSLLPKNLAEILPRTA